MATGEAPFKGYTRDQLIQEVVVEGRRPRCDVRGGLISPALSSLLQQCWHKDPTKRPEFSSVAAELDRMIASECVGEQERGLIGGLTSSWF